MHSAEVKKPRLSMAPRLVPPPVPDGHPDDGFPPPPPPPMREVATEEEEERSSSGDGGASGDAVASGDDGPSGDGGVAGAGGDGAGAGGDGAGAGRDGAGAGSDEELLSPSGDEGWPSDGVGARGGIRPDDGADGGDATPTAADAGGSDGDVGGSRPAGVASGPRAAPFEMTISFGKFTISRLTRGGVCTGGFGANCNRHKDGAKVTRCKKDISKFTEEQSLIGLKRWLILGLPSPDVLGVLMNVIYCPKRHKSQNAFF